MVGGFQDIYGGETTVARLWKWTIDLELGSVKEEQIDDAPCDFPRIDDRRIGLKNDYGYFTTLETEVDTLTIGRHLLKYDLVNNKRLTHDLGENVTGGEALFVREVQILQKMMGGQLAWPMKQKLIDPSY